MNEQHRAQPQLVPGMTPSERVIRAILQGNYVDAPLVFMTTQGDRVATGVVLSHSAGWVQLFQSLDERSDGTLDPVVEIEITDKVLAQNLIQALERFVESFEPEESP